MEKMCICVINRVAAGEFNSRDTPWINWMKMYEKKSKKKFYPQTKNVCVYITRTLSAWNDDDVGNDDDETYSRVAHTPQIHANNFNHL